MNNLLARPDHHPSTSSNHIPPSKSSRGSFLGLALATFTALVILLAFGSGILLLLKDTPLSFLQHLDHAPVSALPLLLIGLASLCFQIIVRPTPLDLFKAAIVSAAFLFWGIDQLLPTGWEATTLGDIVIVLYVIDLGWMMWDRLKKELEKRKPEPIQQEKGPSFSLQLDNSLLISDISHPHQQRDAPHLLKVPIKPSVLKRHRLLPIRASE